MTEPPRLAQVKDCTKCGEAKPLDKFYLINGHRESACKDCRNAARRHRDHIRYTGVSDITPEQEMAMRKKARKCPLCGVCMTNKPGQPNSKHLDHILPLGLGGTHTHGNARVICRTCNLSRPKDGSDVTQVTLWAQGEVNMSRPDGRKNGGAANKETCRKGLHPWTPENIKVTSDGKKLCGPCYQAKEKKSYPRKTCKCGAEYAAPGATVMCPACVEIAARKGAELHATGLSWAQVAARVGYGTAEGARYAAKRIGYTPELRPAQPTPACPGCGQPWARPVGGPRLCPPCTEARAWRAVRLRQDEGWTLRAIADELGFSSVSSVTNLMKTVVEIETKMGRPAA